MYSRKPRMPCEYAKANAMYAALSKEHRSYLAT
jgi:hypothetical protein